MGFLDASRDGTDGPVVAVPIFQGSPARREDCCPSRINVGHIGTFISIARNSHRFNCALSMFSSERLHCDLRHMSQFRLLLPPCIQLGLKSQANQYPSSFASWYFASVRLTGSSAVFMAWNTSVFSLRYATVLHRIGNIQDEIIEYTTHPADITATTALLCLLVLPPK